MQISIRCSIAYELCSASLNVSYELAIMERIVFFMFLVRYLVLRQSIGLITYTFSKIYEEQSFSTIHLGPCQTSMMELSCDNGYLTTYRLIHYSPVLLVYTP